MKEMDFLNRVILWHLLWVLPLLLILLWWAMAQRRKLLRMILGIRAEENEFTTASRTKRILRFWLFVVAMCCLFVAAARPYWGTRILPFSGRGRDLMIVLDVSRSMLADDIKPSRLDHAKWFLRELIKKTPGDRYGIVAFSGDAFLECPMTVDKTSLFQSLDELSPESIPLGGTNIQTALVKTLRAFTAAEGGHRAIILVSDGDELQGRSSAVVKQLQAQKIPIFVVGIGDPSGPGLIRVPTADGKAKVILRDAKGEVVSSKLNEKQLKELARSSVGGVYVRSTVTDPGLKPVVKKIKDLIPEEYTRGNNTRPIERFHFPLFAAVILLLLRMGISERRRSTLALLAVLLFAGSNLPGQNPTPVQPPVMNQAAPQLPTGLDVRDQLEPQPAAAIENTESEPIDLYNQALKLQLKEDSKNAGKLYEDAINSAEANREVRSRSYQNLGVMAHQSSRAMVQQQKLDEALKILNTAEEWYRESLRSSQIPDQVALNQQQLLNDRKQIEEMKKQQQQQQQQKEQKQKQAQQKTKEALKEQQKANQQPQNKEQQKKAEQKTQEAQQATKDLQKEAQKQKDKKTEEAAKSAKQELDKAQQEQQKKDGKKAEEHLKKALKKLEGDKDKQQKDGDDKKQENKDNKDQNQDNKDQPKPDQMPPDTPPQNGDAPENANPQDEKDIDPNQAAALLDLMANDEKSLRDEIKGRMRKDARIKRVEKDW